MWCMKSTATPLRAVLDAILFEVILRELRPGGWPGKNAPARQRGGRAEKPKRHRKQKISLRGSLRGRGAFGPAGKSRECAQSRKVARPTFFGRAGRKSDIAKKLKRR